jgi:hypothetical protein
MPIRDAILSEFDHEMISTRKTLERVPPSSDKTRSTFAPLALRRLHPQ